MIGCQLYTDSLKVIDEDIHKHCAQLGYRIGRELGRDFYAIAFESYWIDETLGEKSLVIKVIDFTNENRSMFVRTAHPPNDSHRHKFKTISVKVGKNKTIPIQTTINRKFVPDFKVFKQEINELNYLNHQNLVIIKNILLFDKQVDENSGQQKTELSHFLMFVEFNNNNLKQKLRQILKKGYYVTEEQSIDWSAQIVRGLGYLHSRAISHSNLKPSNILVFDSRRVKGTLHLKLADYGLAMLFPIQHRVDPKFDDKDLYRDPKIDETFSKLKRKQCTKLSYSATRADIWSLSVIITEFCLEYDHLFKLFVDNSTPTARKKLATVYLDHVKRVGSSTALIDLLSKTLIYEQNRRINILDISRHQWLEETLKQQRKLTRLSVDSNTDMMANESNEQKDIQKNETLDEKVDEDSKTDITVEDAFGLKDNECQKYITEEDGTIE